MRETWKGFGSPIAGTRPEGVGCLWVCIGNYTYIRKATFRHSVDNVPEPQDITRT